MFIVPTGSVIKEYLDEYGMSQKECAERLGISEKHFSNLMKGKSRLTEEVAIKLENIIHDVPASYWLNYESKYREQLKREEMEKVNFDKKDLKQISEKFKFSEVFEGLGWDIQKQASEMLKLLQIGSFDQFHNVYSNLDIDFMEDGGETEAIAIWLNLAREEVEIQNKDLTDKSFDKNKLESSLHKFKKIALNSDYENSLKSARKLLNRLGIYLVFCDAISNSKVRGALTTYKKKPAIFLTGRFKSHDHVWFALMHEIGHLLYHYETDKQFITLEQELKLEVTDIDSKENEANIFARDFFINSNDYQNFISFGEFDRNSIERFADSQNVLPGIVVARLQHDGHIGFEELNYLKNR